MILGHLIADYPLQSCLAQMKRKDFWEGKPERNKNDYIPSLIGHAVMWGIITFIPLIIFGFSTKSNIILIAVWIQLFVNIIAHAIIDHLKANKDQINLIEDQLLHFMQIVIAVCVVVIVKSINNI